MTSLRSGAVTSTAPLEVRFDTDETATPVPSTLEPVASLSVGLRVVCAHDGTELILLGIKRSA